MTIIKGLIYTDGEMLLRPHYSGEFYAVDCDEYAPAKYIRENYSDAEKFIKSGDFLTHKGKKFFRIEYAPHNTKEMGLLSDLPECFDSKTNF